LRESATKLPGNPVVQYHLGLASLKAGDKEAARQALTIALNSPENFPGKERSKEVAG